MKSETRRSPQAAPLRITVSGQTFVAFPVCVKTGAIRQDDDWICPGITAHGTGVRYESKIFPNQLCRPWALDNCG
jgi:hypothetical protein